jgi:hypothetical protein
MIAADRKSIASAGTSGPGEGAGGGSVGGGAGGGGDDMNNGGAGFGVQARPVGAYVIQNGEVSWKPAVDPNRIVAGWQLVSLLGLVVAWAFARALRR